MIGPCCHMLSQQRAYPYQKRAIDSLTYARKWLSEANSEEFQRAGMNKTNNAILNL